MFSLAASMHFCSLMYGIFGVSEPSVENANMSKKPVDDRSLLADFFDKAHVVETFRVAFKNGARQRRLRVIMLIIVVMVVDGPLYGELSAHNASLEPHVRSHTLYRRLIVETPCIYNGVIN